MQSDAMETKCQKIISKKIQKSNFLFDIKTSEQGLQVLLRQFAKVTPKGHIRERTVNDRQPCKFEQNKKNI